MAVVFMEGFDHVTSAQAVAAKGWVGGFIDAWTGRFGGQGMRHQGSTTTHALPGSYTEAIIGAAMQWNSTNQINGNMLGFVAGGTIVAALRVVFVSPNYVWRVVNSAGTTLATGTTPLSTGQWSYLELKVVVSATVGTVEVRLNGAATAECSGTSLNTGSSNIDTIILSALSAQTIFDDVYVVDTSGSSPTNTFLGEVRVCTLIPNGNGANTAWGGTGTGGFGEWDDITAHDDDTTYVSSSTPGDRETSTLTDLSAATSTVFAVQTNLVARKDDAGTRTIAPVVVIGGTPYDGTTTAALSSSYADYTQLYDRLDPSGATWTASTVNAMETGVKEIA